MFKLTFKSNYLKELARRIANWARSNNLKVTLKVPADMLWIWWLEYGTREGKGPYLITPTGNKQQLVFVSNGVLHFEGQVLHPGIRPRRFIATSLPEIRQLYGERPSIMFDDPGQLERFLVSIGEKSRDIIADNMAAVTKNRIEKAADHPYGSEFPNQAGRLKGEAPSDVFRERAEVVVEK